MHALREARHEAEFAPKTQIELGGKVARLARMVGDTPADAWLVFAGSSEVLEWFAASSQHPFAIFGRANQLPTALFIDEAPPVTAALQFCMKRGLRIPEDLSLICTDSDLAFEWCQPTVAHIYWDSRHIIRTIVRWTENIRNGRDDRQKGFFKARFIEGGTIGPAKPLVDGR
jgi:DNA-binding LacI/PurR family transcriptional regulator